MYLNYDEYLKKCRKSYFKLSTCTEGKSLTRYFLDGMQSNVSKHYAISQYPRPSVFPSEYPDSDRPRLKDIKIMGYSLRTSHFRYTIWLEFNARLFKRSKMFKKIRTFVLIINSLVDLCVPFHFRLASKLWRRAIRPLD